MRIALLSDIHLSVNALPFPDVDADIEGINENPEFNGSYVIDLDI